MKQLTSIVDLLKQVRKKNTATEICVALIGLLFLFPSVSLFSSDSLAAGKKLLSEYKAAEAIPLLYEAVSTESPNSNVPLYLGVAYCQLGKYTDAEQWLVRGKESSTVDKHLYLYNLGNVYFLQKRFDDAGKSYTEALSVHKDYSPAVLNRANTYMHSQNHAAALEDYKLYLSLAPATPQKQDIQRLILLLVEEEYIRQVKRIQEETRKLAGTANAGAATGVAGRAGSSTNSAGDSSTSRSKATGFTDGTAGIAPAEPSTGGNSSGREANSNADQNGNSTQPVHSSGVKGTAAGDQYDTLLKEINAALQSVDDASSLSAGSDVTLDYSEDYNLE